MKVRDAVRLKLIWGSLLLISLLAASVALIQSVQSASRSKSKKQTGVTVLRPPALMAGQAATLLPDGRWLLTGGEGEHGPTATALIKDPRTGETTQLSERLKQARAWHTATLLPDGTVLIFGGVGAAGKIVEKAEGYNPDTRKFRFLPTTGLTSRANHSATLLTEGQVLVAGGSSNEKRALASAELWDPKSNATTFLPTELQIPRLKHAATLLPNGDVLFRGGISEAGTELNDSEQFDLEALRFVLVEGFLPTEDGRPPYLLASAPKHNEMSVPLDARLVLRFSKTLRVESVNAEALTLAGPQGIVPAKIIPAEGGMLAFVTPTQPLQPGTIYTLSLSGPIDRTNLPLSFTAITFTTISTQRHEHNPAPDGSLSPDQYSVDDESWIPNEKNFRGEWRSNRENSSWSKLPPLTAADGVTAIAGQVLKLNGQPLPNVTIQIGDRAVRTDGTGRFLLAGINPGRQELLINGHTASSPGKLYAMCEIGINVIDGRTNVIRHTIWLAVIDQKNATPLSVPTTEKVIAKSPSIPGLEVHIPAGVVLRSQHGEPLTSLTITPIPVDRSPIPPPGKTKLLFTLQGHGARVETVDGSPSAVGVRIVLPNVGGLPPGTRVPLTDYDARSGWYVYGQGTVTSNGQQIVPDPNVGLMSLSCIGYFGHAGAPGDGPAPCNECEDGDPVDLGTGLFVYRKTDLILPDVMPIHLTRTYRPNDIYTRPFGFGGSHPYELFLLGDNYESSYDYAELILPDGGRLHYQRISPGSQHVDAVMEHTTTPSRFYKSILFWNSARGGWEIKLQDGTRYKFYVDYSQAEAVLQEIEDRNGNRLTIWRDSSNDYRVTKIQTNNGRWISFTYDASDRITQARDNIGREVNYTYDATGRLWKVTDPNNGVTEYTYDTSHRLVTIKDARGTVFLTNEYNAHGRVSRQTLANGSTYQFAYTLGGNGKVTQTDVTDQRGNIRRLTFNSNGYWLTDTYALGKPEQQTYTYERQAGTNLVLSATDPLGRKTSYAYDSLGNTTSITRLAQTPAAVTTSFTYEPTFNQLASVTDPLNRTTSFSHDSKGNVTSVIDPLSRQSTYTYNAFGQALSVTDPLNNTTQFGYVAGDLVEVRDPLGRVTTRHVDAAGRTIRITDPLGHSARIEYNALNLPTRIINPHEGAASFTYDANGNLLSVTDARGKITSYVYNNMDWIISRTDPLLRAETYEYDVAGNPVRLVDRNLRVTTLGYDNLNRMNFAGFGTIVNGQNTTYESTVNSTYDTAGRLTQIVHSGTGTINLEYDNLNRLTSESSPRGAVGYSYDAVGRRTSMTVTGQPAMSYAYDNGDRLSQITQGATSVGFSYDAADRRTSLTLPNGVVVEYGYDSASQLTGVTYKFDTTVLGNLTYEYDSAGRRVKVGGSYARTGLPQALSNAAYDDANQLVQRGAVSLTYDAEGNLASDGTNAYTWDARNQLSSINGPGLTASFQYDAFGRRTLRTINGNSTGYLYDGADAVQELAGGTPVANLILGGVDEVFSRSDAAGSRSFMTDGLGSTLGLADSSGALTAEFTYDPFGSTTASGTPGNNSAQFTGRENDATGLYYYRARYYSPTLQRFISQDPVGFAGGDTNLYAYVANDPVNNTDASGLAADIAVDLGFIGYDIYELATGGPKDRTSNLIALGADVVGAIVPFVTGLGAATRAARAAGTYSDIRRAGLRDAHHVIQDAAVRDLPGYSRSAAPAVHLPGPSTKVGSPHYCATRVQAQRGGGTYGAERRIGYKAARRAGLSKSDARELIRAADDYFNGIGVNPRTPTRTPGTRY
ncbi:MAG TPA: RHS repeat-associated core domain-containing protein [Pyrinomonadaceae bacterium]|nr:RHS repeat-associated core domain-containing protein [Pyrinomonadaceae bacterium]